MPRIPTCEQEFKEPHAHTLTAQRPLQHRENTFLHHHFFTKPRHAHNLTVKPAMLVQLRQTIVCRPPPSAPALLVRMLTCASEGASGQGRADAACKRAHTRGGLSQRRGGLSHLRVEPNVLCPVCPRTAPARAVAQHSARRASSRAARAAAGQRAHAPIAIVSGAPRGHCWCTARPGLTYTSECRPQESALWR
jgi:hypothetical protein